MSKYNLIHEFLEQKFKGFYKWLAFDHKFFVSDCCKGRHETMKVLREFIAIQTTENGLK